MGQQSRHPLPAAVAEALELRAGDEAQIHVEGKRGAKLSRLGQRTINGFHEARRTLDYLTRLHGG